MTVSSPVELLCLTQRAPLLVHGTLSHPDMERWLFTPTEPISLDVVDCNAIVNVDNDTPMMTLHIVKQENGQLELHTISKHPREKRHYPRLFSVINLYLHSTSDADNIKSWMSSPDRINEIDDSWIHPEPFMNFSVNGTAFTWTGPLSINEKLLVAFHGGGALDSTLQRGIARVVRSEKIDEEHWEIALYFEQMTDEAVEHMVQLTMRLQDSML